MGTYSPELAPRHVGVGHRSEPGAIRGIPSSVGWKRQILNFISRRKRARFAEKCFSKDARKGLAAKPPSVTRRCWQKLTSGSLETAPNTCGNAPGGEGSGSARRGDDAFSIRDDVTTGRAFETTSTPRARATRLGPAPAPLRRCAAAPGPTPAPRPLLHGCALQLLCEAQRPAGCSPLTGDA